MATENTTELVRKIKNPRRILYVVLSLIAIISLPIIKVAVTDWKKEKAQQTGHEVAVAVNKSKVRYQSTVTTTQWSEKIDLDAKHGEQIVYVPCVGGVQCEALINEKYPVEFPIAQGQVDQNDTSNKSYIPEKVTSVRWRIKAGQPAVPVKTAWSTFYGGIAPEGWYTKAVESSYYASN